jgi:hypothetical protein
MMHVGPPVLDAHRQLLEPDLALGEACDAVYSVDGQWYPGSVVKDRYMMADGPGAAAGASPLLDLDAHTFYTIDFNGYNEQEPVHCSMVRRRLRQGDCCEAVHPHYEEAATAVREAKDVKSSGWGSEAKKAAAAAAAAEKVEGAEKARWQKGVVQAVTAEGYTVGFTEWSDKQINEDVEEGKEEQTERGVDEPLTVTVFAGDARRCAHGLSPDEHYKPSERPEPVQFLTELHDGVYHSLTVKAPAAAAPKAAQQQKGKGKAGAGKSAHANPKHANPKYAQAVPVNLTVDRLIPGHTYAMRTRAINSAGEGPVTEPSLVRTQPAPPARPPPPRLVEATRDSLKLVLSRPYEEFGSAIDSWRVELKEDALVANSSGGESGGGSYLVYGTAALVALINTSKKSSDGFRAVYSGPLVAQGVEIGGAAGEKPNVAAGLGAVVSAGAGGKNKGKSKKKGGAQTASPKAAKSSGGSNEEAASGVSAAAVSGPCVRHEITIRGLPSGEGHWVRVSAHNAAGLSVVSAAARFFTAAAPPTPPPRPEVKVLLVRITDAGQQQEEEEEEEEGQVEQIIECRWVSPVRDNGSEVLRYTVQKAIVEDDGTAARKKAIAWVDCDMQEHSDGTADEPADTAGGVLPLHVDARRSGGGGETNVPRQLRYLYTERGATSGNTYHFRVQAANAVGAGGFSESVKCRTGESLPGAPAPPTVVSTQPTIVKLKWEAPSDTGGATITGFALQQWEYPLGAPITRPLTGSDTMRITKLKPATEYRFRVLAANKMGDGPWSEWVGLTTAPPAAAAAEATEKGKRKKSGFDLAQVPLGEAPAMLECVEFYPTQLDFVWEEVDAATRLQFELAEAHKAAAEAGAMEGGGGGGGEGGAEVAAREKNPPQYHVFYQLEMDDGNGGQFVRVYNGVDAGATVGDLRPSRNYRTRVQACVGLGATYIATADSKSKKSKSSAPKGNCRIGPYSDVEFVCTLAAESRATARGAEQRLERIEAKEKKIVELRALIAAEDGLHEGDKWKVRLRVSSMTVSEYLCKRLV